MRRMIVFFALISMTFPSGMAYAQKYWQLTFSHAEDRLALESAAPIASMAKQVKTPGLEGAPVILPYELRWLSSQGKTLNTVSTEIPLAAC